MDRAEAGGGQRQEHSRMQGNRLVDSLSAFKSGPDEVAGIPPVDGGARRTPDLRARAAGLQHDTVGKRSAREGHGLLADWAGHDIATKPDGTSAPAAAIALRQELVDLVSSAVADERFEHRVVVGIHAGHGGAPV
jgi:hypothetical protein